MLSSLIVKNVAVIRDITINFGNGLNVITGETGAGKSIIIDSLNFVLGERADKSLIRYGEDTALVQALFIIENDINSISKLFEEQGIDFDNGNIIIRRLLTSSGRSDCRINGNLVTINCLKAIVSKLVDVHSQHQTQSLLNEQNHILILDNFNKHTTDLKNSFIMIFEQYKDILAKISSYPKDSDISIETDILNYQIAEIEEANITTDEEELLIKQRNILQNMERIKNSISSAILLLEGNDFMGIEPSILNIIKEINFIIKYDDSYSDIVERLSNLLIEVRDIKDTLSDRIANNLYDLDQLPQIETRIDLIRKIKKKYGKTDQEICLFLEKSKNRLEFLLSSEDNLKELKLQEVAYASKVIDFATKLHDSRVRFGKEMSKAIVQQLVDLGMKQSSFEIDINKYDENNPIQINNLNKNGADSVKFLISLNAGEPLKELSKVASGGEMSRIMLALKNITADLENIETQVFDEIDTGISGNAAKTVAKKLYNISKGRQTIVVTHLAQIAAMADSNFLITKNIYDAETITEISKLEEEGVLNELMRISGSDSSSNAGYESAKELRSWANINKIA